jgi:Fe-S oxidoreductase
MGFGERAVSVSKQAQLLEEFLANEAKADQKSFAAVTSAMELLKLIPNSEPKLIESSCCGMAGSFG